MADDIIEQGWIDIVGKSADPGVRREVAGLLSGPSPRAGKNVWYSNLAKLSERCPKSRGAPELIGACHGPRKCDTRGRTTDLHQGVGASRVHWVCVARRSVQDALDEGNVSGVAKLTERENGNGLLILGAEPTDQFNERVGCARSEATCVLYERAKLTTAEELWDARPADLSPRKVLDLGSVEVAEQHPSLRQVANCFDPW